MSSAKDRLTTTIALFALLSAPAAAGGLDDVSGGPGLGLQAGGMVMVAPKYEGANSYEVIGFPFVAPAGLDQNSRLRFNGPDDLRVRVLEFGGFEVGPLAGWRFDRDEDDSSRLDGLGDVDGGFVIGGYTAYRAGPFLPFVSYHHQVSGDETGGLLRFGAEADLPVWAAVRTKLTAGATYADDDFMDAYFSVSPGQSAASTAGLAVYDADAGVKDVYIGMSSDVPLTDAWTLKIGGRYTRLIGDAADSPIVESEDQFFGGLGLTYRFEVAR